MTPRTRLTKDDRRVQILEAARRVFLTLGPRTRVSDIADEAGINVALIYQHFDSKDELFAAAVVYPIEQIVDRLGMSAVALPPDTDVEQRENTLYFMREVLGALLESIPLFGIVLFADFESGRRFYNERIAPLFDDIMKTVSSNLNSWSHRDFDFSVTTPAAFGMCWGVAMDAAFRGITIDVDRAAKQLNDVIFDGLGTLTATPLKEAP